jgi:ribonuclease E
VDIIVPEPVTTPQVEKSADGGAGNGDAPAAAPSVASDDQASHAGAETQNGHAGGAVAEPAAPPAPPRRRRAASRPAGPAAGNGGEALVLTVPADQPTP